MEPEENNFNCVVMKRKGAERVRAETQGMNLQQELEYWKRGTKELRARQIVLQEHPPKNSRKSAAAGNHS